MGVARNPFGGCSNTARKQHSPLPLLPSSRVPWVLLAVLASLVLPVPRYVPCGWSREPPPPHPITLTDCPLDSPPTSLLRSVSHPHPLLLSAEARTSQAVQSPDGRESKM